MRQQHFLHLRRIYGEQGTNGTLYYRGKKICYTIELPWRNNIQRLSCIPGGIYKLHKRNYTRHGEQIGFSTVLNREAILIHAANDAQRDLQGCIAPVTTLIGEGKGTDSRKALAELKSVVYALWDMDQEVYLQIN